MLCFQYEPIIVFRKEDLPMGYYFHDEQAISAKTQDIRTVLETVANRYIGQNPPFGVSYYTYQKNGSGRISTTGLCSTLPAFIRWPQTKPVYMRGVSYGAMMIHQ